MLPRLTIGFIVLSTAIVIAACSSYGSASVNVGPNFPPMTLYATNSNQNAIGIYNKGQKTGTGPSFEIGGTTTTLNGPQYVAFDVVKNLWVTNYNPSTNSALLIEFEALATGNVIPLLSTPIAGRPRGIAISPKDVSAKKVSLMIIADVIPTAKYPSELLLFTEGSTTPYQAIAGPLPGLKVPGGVALDSKNRNLRYQRTRRVGRSVHPADTYADAERLAESDAFTEPDADRVAHRIAHAVSDADAGEHPADVYDCGAQHRRRDADRRRRRQQRQHLYRRPGPPWHPIFGRDSRFRAAENKGPRQRRADPDDYGQTHRDHDADRRQGRLDHGVDLRRGLKEYLGLSDRRAR